MSDAQLTAIAAVVVWIFSAGAFYAWTRGRITELTRELEEAKTGAAAELKTAKQDLYRDLNGVGNRVRVNQDAAARRHQNISLAIVHAAPPNKEKELVELLKENS